MCGASSQFLAQVSSCLFWVPRAPCMLLHVPSRAHPALAPRSQVRLRPIARVPVLCVAMAAVATVTHEIVALVTFAAATVCSAWWCQRLGVKSVSSTISELAVDRRAHGTTCTSVISGRRGAHAQQALVLNCSYQVNRSQQSHSATTHKPTANNAPGSASGSGPVPRA